MNTYDAEVNTVFFSNSTQEDCNSEMEKTDNNHDQVKNYFHCLFVCSFGIKVRVFNNYSYHFQSTILTTDGSRAVHSQSSPSTENIQQDCNSEMEKTDNNHDQVKNYFHSLFVCSLGIKVRVF